MSFVRAIDLLRWSGAGWWWLYPSEMSVPTLVIIMMWSHTRIHSLLLQTIRQCTAPPVTIFIIITHYVSLIVPTSLPRTELRFYFWELYCMLGIVVRGTYLVGRTSAPVRPEPYLKYANVRNGKYLHIVHFSHSLHKLLSSVTASAWLDGN